MKRACHVHDAINLALLPIIGALTLAGLVGWIPAEVVTATFLVYVAGDFVWVALQPDAVPSLPGFILLHHVVTVMLLLIPFRRPHLHWYVSLMGTVEFNTFCLIARRQWRPLRKLFSWLYWGTFFPLRMVLYPALVPFFLHNMRFVEMAPLWETVVVVGCQTVLCCFNIVLLVLTVLNWRKRGSGSGSGGAAGHAKAGVPSAVAAGSALGGSSSSSSRRGVRQAAGQQAPVVLLEAKPVSGDAATVLLKARAL